MFGISEPSTVVGENSELIQGITTLTTGKHENRSISVDSMFGVFVKPCEISNMTCWFVSASVIGV